MSKVERINECYEYLRSIGKIHTKRDLSDLLDVAPSNLTKAFKGDTRYLTDNFLRRFNLAFDYLFSEEWLITGEGSMLTEDTIVPESMDTPEEMDEVEAMKQTIRELLDEKKLLKNENKTLHDTNARLSISIERLTELLYEKTARHA